jgi:hypothetical protein
MSPIRTASMARGARDEALKSGAGMRCRAAKPTPALRASWRSLQALPGVLLPSLHRMADFALWATACGATLWPAGAFAHAYDANRKAASSRRIQWQFASEDSWPSAPVGRERPQTSCASPPIWPSKHPGALAGRLHRVQTPLRMLGIEICFSRRKQDMPDPRAVVLGRLQVHYR